MSSNKFLPDFVASSSLIYINKTSCSLEFYLCFKTLYHFAGFSIDKRIIRHNILICKRKILRDILMIFITLNEINFNIINYECDYYI